MKTKFALFLAVFLVLSLASCATLFKGTTEEVNFGSNPTGAEVWVDGKLMGTTPINFRLITKKVYLIEFKYQDQTKSVYLNNHVGAGWIVLDVLGGLVPVIIDAVTGAWYSFDQSNVNVDFRTPGAFEPAVL
ncbi:MAG TPA: PEGA domain-containing protein [Candidatus Aminicenantes bacterium]|nr:PEGA domain-containing protein [Candidatus Aminicenantes bacterium]HOF82961.1 PEGA domain-containing protein [Candidatus Aminicenantes bacterium]HOS11282.1 PEGA domain-containing protein [Candidatus Aminicenantes bacterium]HPL13957.1 PEGA domain-containing protein [Candidatus Aminicenantes bacterium]HQF97386.1 PEGA domain-containing protein [Candidatus Aminicenantes bacterium]